MLTDFAFFRIICSSVVADSLNGPYNEDHLARLWKAVFGVFVVQNTCVRSDNESVSYIRLIGLEHLDHLKRLSRGHFGKRLDVLYPFLEMRYYWLERLQVKSKSQTSPQLQSSRTSAQGCMDMSKLICVCVCVARSHKLGHKALV